MSLKTFFNILVIQEYKTSLFCNPSWLYWAQLWTSNVEFLDIYHHALE